MNKDIPKIRMRLAVGIAIDCATISKGKWVSKDVLCLGQWIGVPDQLAMEKAMGGKLTAEHLRNLAGLSIGLPNMADEVGLSAHQVRAIQYAYEADPQNMIDVLTNAMQTNGTCVLEGVEFCFA
jgi:hypothetical protein